MQKLRHLSVALGHLPVWNLTQISRHWQFDPDTTRKILVRNQVKPVLGRWKRKRYSILEVWRVEGVPESQMMDAARHAELQETLISASTFAKAVNCSPATVRRYARENYIQSIWFGGSIRFRPSTLRAFLQRSEVEIAENRSLN